MPFAVAVTTWLQLGAVVIAAAAAVAAWATVRQSRDATEAIRRSEREARQPLLLLAPGFTNPGAGARTMVLGIYNAGDVALDVGVALVGEEELARNVVGFMRPGETVNFGSEVPATGNFRAFVFARSKDGDRWAWDHNRVRRAIPSETPGDEEWKATLAAFFPDEDFNRLRPVLLLRADDRLY